jgi:hypothetical protein
MTAHDIHPRTNPHSLMTDLTHRARNYYLVVLSRPKLAVVGALGACVPAPPPTTPPLPRSPSHQDPRVNQTLNSLQRHGTLQNSYLLN